MNRNVPILSVVMIAVTLLTAAAVAFAAENEGGAGQEKVTICHKGHTITVGAPALAAHKGHGDTEGACPTDPATPEPPDDTTMPDTTMPDTTMPDTTASQNGGLGRQTDDLDGINRGADLYGDSAADKLRGGPNADFLQGGRGPDRMFGSASNDYIDGVDGIAGNDELDGGWGTDHCVGDEGDTFANCDGNAVEVPVPSDAAAATGAGH